MLYDVVCRPLLSLTSALFAALMIALCGFVPPAIADDSLQAGIERGRITAQGSGFSNAKAISLGTWCKTEVKAVYAEDNDVTAYDYESEWFRFALPASGKVAIEKPWVVNCDIYDAYGELVDTYAAFGDQQSGSIDLTGGTYYIRFTTYWGAGSVDFRVSFTSASESFSEVQGGGGNNTVATASAVALGTAYRGQIALNDSVDWYRFDLPSAGRVSLSFSSYISSADFNLYGAQGMRLHGESDVTSDPDREYSSRDWQVDLTKGVYYFQVKMGESSSATGNYSFSIGFANANETFSESQGGSDNGPGYANKIALGTSYRGQLALNDAKDYYSFKTKGSGVVKVTVSSGMPTTGYAFYDAYGDSLASETGSWNEVTGTQSFSWTVDLGKGTFLFSVDAGGYGYDDFGEVVTGPYSFKIVELRDIAKAKVSKIKAKVYTGKKIKPKLKVKFAGKRLKLNRDYKVKFSKNKKVGRAKATIVGIGDYTGAKVVKFKIKKAKQKVKAKGKTWYANSKYLWYEPVGVDKSYICTIKKAKGKVTFSKLRASACEDNFVVKRSGRVIVREGTPEGTYRLVVKARAKGNRNYKAGSTRFTTTVVVEYW